MSEVINRPHHYTFGKIEAIEAFESFLSPEEFRGFLKGQIAKYLWREKHKGGTDSIRKLKWYAEQLISYDERQAVNANNPMINIEMLVSGHAAPLRDSVPGGIGRELPFAKARA
jgi:hypothetical protein